MRPKRHGAPRPEEGTPQLAPAENRLSPREVVIVKLQQELKGLCSPSILVIDYKNAKQEGVPPEQRVDILVDAKQPAEVSDVEEYLATAESQQRFEVVRKTARDNGGVFMYLKIKDLSP